MATSKVQENVNHVVNLYNMGESVEKIAETTGKSLTWVRLCLAHGLIQAAEERKVPKEPPECAPAIDKIEYLRAKGHTLREIGEHFGRSESWACYALQGKYDHPFRNEARS